jgi:hypothetical protein
MLKEAENAYSTLPDKCCGTCKRFRRNVGGFQNGPDGIFRQAGMCMWRVPKTPDSVTAYIPEPDDRARMAPTSGTSCECWMAKAGTK